MFGLPWGRKGYTYDNTRRWLRLPAAWPVKCDFLQQAAGQKPQVTESVDVGAGGISILVPQNIAAGNLLRLEIYAPSLKRSFGVEGQVVRSTPVGQTGYELGIRFSRIDPADQQILNEAIERFYNPRQLARQKSGVWWRNLP